jgi:hypothetical protein
MVDSRDKGARAETVVRDTLRKATGLGWERTPLSGALDPKHGMKADLYIPNEKNLYAVEVKHYADCHIDHSLISGKSPQLLEWWDQAVRGAEQTNKQPLLIFKHDRSKLYTAFSFFPEGSYPYIFVSKDNREFYISLLDDFLKYEQPKFIA